MDAELGILLRRIETSGSKLVTLTELTDLTMNPPEAADPVRFAPPPGSNRSEDPAAGPPKWSTGPVETNAISLAMGDLGALIRYAPHRPGHGPAGQDPAAMMPSPDPAPLGPGDDISPPDEVLDLLYRGGEPRDLGATVRQWDDQAAMSERVSEDIRAAGPPGGVGYYFDAVARYQTVTRTVARLRVSGPDRYRLEYSSRPDGFAPVIAACDGERRWRVVQDRIVVGPAAPLRTTARSWPTHAGCSAAASGGQEITYRGRPARQLRVTPVPGREEMVLWPLTMYPTDAIVDAETGCLLRLISYAGDTLARWLELDDISTEPADPDEFRVHVPPGTRTVEETGDLITDSLATMPGPTGTAFRVAAETAPAPPPPSPPPAASWTTCAAIARQEHAALITVAAGARGRLRVRGQDIATSECKESRSRRSHPQTRAPGTLCSCCLSVDALMLGETATHRRAADDCAACRAT